MHLQSNGGRSAFLGHSAGGHGEAGSAKRHASTQAVSASRKKTRAVDATHAASAEDGAASAATGSTTTHDEHTEEMRLRRLIERADLKKVGVDEAVGKLLNATCTVAFLKRYTDRVQR